ncbi:MAG: radical SAM protein [Prevotella sp.]|nr:radical SAM protein [Prevotella sp.]
MMQSQAPWVYIITYGCKVNYYESEAVAAQLDALGIPNQMVADGALARLPHARVFLVNSCAVTSMAEKKSRYGVAKIKKYHSAAAVVTMGCAFGRKTAEMAALEIADLLGVGRGGVPPATVIHRREKAFIKVQDGCQNFCSYCIIPHIRKTIECRSIADVVAEIRAQPPHVTSVVLCGINLCYYPDFAALCRAVDACGLAWEISSLEPPLMTAALIDTLRHCAHFVPHFHICLQSGCDAVLRDMNRHYTTAQYAQIVADIRAAFPDATIGTDLIVGFPTETAAAFQTTLAFLQTLKLDRVHLFPYSPRVGTPAAALKPITNAVVTARMAEIRFTLFSNCDKY